MARFSGSSFTPKGGGSAITIVLANGAAFIARFHQRKAGLELVTDRSVNDVADDIVIAAKDLVAVDTGKTKDHIRKERRKRNEVYVVSDRGGDRDEVPIYLEIGTFKMAARPFMKPAADIVMGAGGFNTRITAVGGLLGPVGKIHT